MLSNDIDIKAILLEEYEEHDSMWNGRYNKTSVFCLPFIDMAVGTNITNRYLRNAFLDDRSIEHDFIRPLFLLFEVKNTKDKFWCDFCKTAPLRDTYVTDYYVGIDKDGCELFMYVFQIPKQWENDFNKFQIGRYSLLSEAYKSKFSQYTYSPSGVQRETRMWGILNKSNSLKDEVVKEFIVPSTSTADDVRALRRDMDTWDEIWDAPQDREEIFYFENRLDATKNTTGAVHVQS